MAPQDRRGNHGKQGYHGSGHGPSREVMVSKALSWLLRHGAAKERIAMDGQGYVKVDELLKWHKLKALKVEMEELVAVVEGNEKKRFALRWIAGCEEAGIVEMGGGGGVVEEGEATTTTTITTMTTSAGVSQSGQPAEELTDQPTETETQRAIQHAATDLDPSHYLIRATQGHSLKTLDASAYLTPITLDDPKSIPETVVHGTFYRAWRQILASKGLKPMTRVHVHFARGPVLEDVLMKEEGGNAGGPDGRKKPDVVISGMRSDAQILIYVDIRRALEAGVEFWRSENGVVLTEGVTAEGGEGAKMLSSDFWDVVVEVKADKKVLWKQGVGVVRELLAGMNTREMPRGKERVKLTERAGRGGGVRRGRGSEKPKLRVEHDYGEVG